MRKFLAVLTLVLPALFAGGAAPKMKPVPPQVGQRAPDFTLIDQNGKRAGLSDARGQKVVLVFYRGYW